MGRIIKIGEKPWVYILFTKGGGYFLDIPYSPKSGVEASMTIGLTDNEVILMNKDEAWLSSFCQEIQSYSSRYKGRRLNFNILVEYNKQENGS